MKNSQNNIIENHQNCNKISQLTSVEIISSKNNPVNHILEITGLYE